MSEKRLLTPEQVADRLQMSPFTIRDYLRTGVLTGIKLPKGWRVREADLQAFIAEHVHRSVKGEDH